MSAHNIVDQIAASSPDSAVILVTTRTIDKSESHKIWYLTLAGGFTVTLPAAVIGFRAMFRVAIAPTTAYILKTPSSANIFYGMGVERAGGAGYAIAAKNTINLVASQAIIGDWIDIDCDGTNWYVRSMVDVIAGITAA